VSENDVIGHIAAFQRGFPDNRLEYQWPGLNETAGVQEL